MSKSYLYRHDFPLGKLFEDGEEYGQALKDGWVEAPWLVEQPVEKEILTATSVPDKPKPKRTARKRTSGDKNRKRPGNGRRKNARSVSSGGNPVGE